MSWRGIATMALIAVTLPVFMLASIAALPILLVGFVCDELRAH